MNDYVEKMIQILPQKLKSTEMAITPAGNNIFENGNGNPLAKPQSEYFHMMVDKALFLSKRARPNIQTMIYVLVTRIISPNIIDWKN